MQFLTTLPCYAYFSNIIFSVQQHICYSALYAIAHPSVRSSVCHTGGSVKDSRRILFAASFDLIVAACIALPVARPPV